MEEGATAWAGRATGLALAAFVFAAAAEVLAAAFLGVFVASFAGGAVGEGDAGVADATAEVVME